MVPSAPGIGITVVIIAITIIIIITDQSLDGHEEDADDDGGDGYGGSLDCLWIDNVQTKYNFVVPLRFTLFQYSQLIFLDFIVLFGTIVNNKIK